jgi:hypothetical protein
MNSRTYSILLLVPVLGLAAVAFFMLIYNQPLEGDLTRIGGFTERHFGWNKPQRAIAENTVAFAKYAADVHKYYDVVVLGDSFSHFGESRLFRWQQYFSSATGLSVMTYHIDDVWLEDLLSSASYRQAPPRLLVLEFVERNIVILAGKGRLAECEPLREQVMPAMTVADRPIEEAALYRKSGIASLDEVLSYLRQKFRDKNAVDMLPLTNDKLFSNADSDQLLVIDYDRRKYEVSDANLQRLGCYLRNMQQRVEANGKTRFVVMVPPDKTTAYCPYIDPAAHTRCEGVIGKMDVPGLHLLRLDRDVAAALRRGTVDLYLPNDTHWGYAGSKLAANAVGRWLRNSQ